MNNEQEIAKLTPRVIGGLIDLIIILITTAVLIFFWGMIVGASGTERHLSSEQADALWTGRGALVGLLVDFVYTVGMQNSAAKATLGQKLMGLQIFLVTYQDAGFGRLILRYFVSLVSSIILKIGFIIALFTDKNQTLHDLAAGTIVVFKKQKYLNPRKVEISKLTSPPANDEVYYELALEEFDANRRKGLWVKLLTENEGDEVKSKFQYIKARAQGIQLEDADQKLKNQPNLIAVKTEAATDDSGKLASSTANDNYKTAVYQDISSLQVKDKLKFTSHKESGDIYATLKTGLLDSEKKKFEIKFKFDHQHRSILHIASQVYVLTNDENAKDACISTCTTMNKNDILNFIEYLLEVPIDNANAAADQRKKLLIEKVDRIMNGHVLGLTANSDNAWMQAIGFKDIDEAYKLFNSSIIKSARN